MSIRVGHKKPIARNAQARRLVKERLFALLGRAAKEGRYIASLQVDRPNLAVISVGHIDRAAMIGNADGMLQASVLAGAVDVAKLEEPFADQGLHPALAVHWHPADRTDFGISDIKILAI